MVRPQNLRSDLRLHRLDEFELLQLLQLHLKLVLLLALCLELFLLDLQDLLLLKELLGFSF
ncbi:hypothetical protein C1H46_010978 [Malus baccata]|uniref:Uncharacterized protein n=1 Tax=Malus baccata TaxID=106549 RepID=A0A540MYU7_MALBA|nr:hypothetical protein C1H46_010978 [Malus baccata]